MSRRELGLPLVSLLDILFGTFGAMVVVAMMLTFLRLEGGAADEDSTYLAIVNVAGAATTRGEPEIDFADIYVDFCVFCGDEAGVPGRCPRYFGPTPENANVDGVESAYHATADRSGTTAAFLMADDLVCSGDMGLEAEIKNLSFLTPQGLNGRQRIAISVVVHTPSTGCAVVRDLTLQELRDAGDDGDRIPVFDLVSSDDALCREGEERLEVRNGRLVLGPVD